MKRQQTKNRIGIQKHYSKESQIKIPFDLEDSGGIFVNSFGDVESVRSKIGKLIEEIELDFPEFKLNTESYN